MKVIAHLGEPYWRAINTRAVEMQLPDHATVAMMLSALFEQYPSLAPDLRDGEVRPAILVDDDEAQPDMMLHDGLHLHIVWPVSGG